jgi:hypothetical protein
MDHGSPYAGFSQKSSRVKIAFLLEWNLDKCPISPEIFSYGSNMPGHNTLVGIDRELNGITPDI